MNLVITVESILELRSQLAATNDEREQAGLLDAIGIQLTLQNQPLEALEYSSRAVEIRASIADREVQQELPFASSLFNRGGHLRVLKRFEEAVASYTLALQVCERHLAESEDRHFRYVEAFGFSPQRASLSGHGCAFSGPRRAHTA
jgi:hypothetical protein